MCELKPCPFCGEIPCLYYDKEHDLWFVGCLNNDCFPFVSTDWHETDADAINAWNRGEYDE